GSGRPFVPCHRNNHHTRSRLDLGKAGESTLALLMAESPARTAFAEEALTHLDTLYRGALRLTRDPDQAQDLVQEAYLRALRYQHSYQPGTNMKAWLFAIMRNLFWDRFKGGRKEDISLDDLGDFALYDTLKDSSAIPETEVLDQIAAGEVVKAVEKLPPRHREVVLLPAVRGAIHLPVRPQAPGPNLHGAGGGPGRPPREAPQDPLLTLQEGLAKRPRVHPRTQFGPHAGPAAPSPAKRSRRSPG